MENKQDRMMIRFLTGVLTFVAFLMISVVLLAHTVEKISSRSVVTRVGAIMMIGGIRQQLKVSEGESVTKRLNDLISEMTNMEIRPLAAFDFKIGGADLGNKTDQQFLNYLARENFEPFYDRGLDYLREMCHDPVIKKQLDYALEQTQDPDYFSPAYLHTLAVSLRNIFIVISALLLVLLFFLSRGQTRILLPAFLFIAAGSLGFALRIVIISFFGELSDTLGISSEQIKILFGQVRPMISDITLWYFLIFGVGLILLILDLGVGFFISYNNKK